jgi:hypothetical protein
LLICFLQTSDDELTQRTLQVVDDELTPPKRPRCPSIARAKTT